MSAAYGNLANLYGPFFPSTGHLDTEDPVGKFRNVVLRVYFLFSCLQRRYAMTPVREIRYSDGATERPTLEALKANDQARWGVRVTYRNGVEVVAWASAAEGVWKTRVAAAEVELPPSGFAAADREGLLVYSARRNGTRADYCRCKEYLFCDGRGRETDFGEVIAAQQVVLLFEPGELRVILAGGQRTVRLRTGPLKKMASWQKMTVVNGAGEVVEQPRVRTDGSVTVVGI